MGAGLRVALVAAGLGALAGPAAAGSCYDVFGCSDRDVFRLRDLLRGPTCEFLYEMRNAIYAERGYCFRTERAIRTFGNTGCRFEETAAVPLNRVERANVATIARAERMQGCPP